MSSRCGDCGSKQIKFDRDFFHNLDLDGPEATARCSYCGAKRTVYIYLEPRSEAASEEDDDGEDAPDEKGQPRDKPRDDDGDAEANDQE